MRSAFYGFSTRSDVVREGDVRLVLRGPCITETRVGHLFGTGHGLAVLVDAENGRVSIEDTCRVRMTLGEHDVAVGLHDIEGTVFDESNHGFVKGGLHRHEIGHLFVGEVLIDHVLERRGEHIFVPAIGGVGTVTFCKLPDEHGGQVVLISCHQHVPCCRNTRLEVVRNGGVFSRAHRLETVVPP